MLLLLLLLFALQHCVVIVKILDDNVAVIVLFAEQYHDFPEAIIIVIISVDVFIVLVDGDNVVSLLLLSFFFRFVIVNGGNVIVFYCYYHCHCYWRLTWFQPLAPSTPSVYRLPPHCRAFLIIIIIIIIRTMTILIMLRMIFRTRMTKTTLGLLFAKPSLSIFDDYGQDSGCIVFRHTSYLAPLSAFGGDISIPMRHIYWCTFQQQQSAMLICFKED